MVSGRLGQSDENRAILSENPVRRVHHDRAHCGVDLRPLRQHRGPKLTGDFLNNSRAIARSIADSNVDLIVHKNYSALQSIIDQFVEISSISYVFVVDEKGMIIAHTFVPGVPDEILADYKNAKDVYDRTLAGLGNFSEVTAGILAGEAGYVHVGMDKGYIALQVQTAIGKEVYLLSIILIVSVLASYGLMYLVSRPLDHLRSYAWHFVVQRAARVAPGFLPGQASARAYRRGGRARPDNPLGFRPGVVSMHAKERVPNRWLIATMCTVLQLCLGTVYAWSYFQPLLVEQFRWTNTETSWAFSLTICCLGLSAAWGGINLARIGPRKLAVAGGLLFAAGYALAAVALAVKSLTLFYLGYGAVAGIGIGLGYVTPMSTVTKWFPDKKGLMTGIVAMGFGLGAFILSFVLAPILMHVFHRNLALVFAAMGAILGSAAFGSAAMLRDPPADYLPSGYVPSAAKDARAASPYAQAEEASDLPLKEYVLAGQYAIMWFIFFLNIMAGISIISFLSPLYQDIWRLDHPTLERSILAGYGATLIAVSSLFNGFGRIVWGAVSERLGRINTFRLLLASQLVVFGILMTEHDPWVFAILVCYVLSCFGGGFAIMPSMVIDVYGQKRMSRVYGVILTAWSAAGILGPMMVASLKDNYPDRAIVYSFLLGMLVLGVGFIFSFLVNDDRFIPRRILLQVFATAPPPMCDPEKPSRDAAYCEIPVGRQRLSDRMA